MLNEHHVDNLKSYANVISDYKSVTKKSYEFEFTPRGVSLVNKRSDNTSCFVCRPR